MRLIALGDRRGEPYDGNVRLVLISVLASCGRVGFEASSTPSQTDAGSDASGIDAPPVMCLAPHVKLSTGCYRLGSGLAAAAAQDACAVDGGHLAVIDDLAENMALTTFEGMTSAWIGFVDPGTGFVTLTSNTTPQFTHWAPGDPNGEGGCARLLEGTGNWDDEPCSRVQSYLCEVDGKQAAIAVP